MSEITKLYENAGIKKLLYCDICKAQEFALGLCAETKCEPFYPSFTAEKQIELIKWLGKLDGKLEINCTYNKEKFIFNFYFNRKTDKNPDPIYPYSGLLDEDFDILIVKQSNELWQDLTEEEKQQIKEILK